VVYPRQYRVLKSMGKRKTGSRKGTTKVATPPRTPSHHLHAAPQTGKKKAMLREGWFIIAAENKKTNKEETTRGKEKKKNRQPSHIERPGRL